MTRCTLQLIDRPNPLEFPPCPRCIDEVMRLSLQRGSSRQEDTDVLDCLRQDRPTAPYPAWESWGLGEGMAYTFWRCARHAPKNLGTLPGYFAET